MRFRSGKWAGTQSDPSSTPGSTSLCSMFCWKSPQFGERGRSRRQQVFSQDALELGFLHLQANHQITRCQSWELGHSEALMLLLVRFGSGGCLIRTLFGTNRCLCWNSGDTGYFPAVHEAASHLNAPVGVSRGLHVMIYCFLRPGGCSDLFTRSVEVCCFWLESSLS